MIHASPRSVLRAWQCFSGCPVAVHVDRVAVSTGGQWKGSLLDRGGVTGTPPSPHLCTRVSGVTGWGHTRTHHRPTTPSKGISLGSATPPAVYSVCMVSPVIYSVIRISMECMRCRGDTWCCPGTGKTASALGALGACQASESSQVHNNEPLYRLPDGVGGFETGVSRSEWGG